MIKLNLTELVKIYTLVTQCNTIGSNMAHSDVALRKKHLVFIVNERRMDGHGRQLVLYDGTKSLSAWVRATRRTSPAGGRARASGSRKLEARASPIASRHTCGAHRDSKRWTLGATHRLEPKDLKVGRCGFDQRVEQWDDTRGVVMDQNDVSRLSGER